ncbi:MAG: hypothetical protein R2932_59805 [Caldilineaceae bacterium]
MGCTQFRYYDDTVRRVFMAGYVLHDWLKLPEVEAELATHGEPRRGQSRSASLW